MTIQTAGKIRAILLDWDGTIADSFPLIYLMYQEFFKKAFKTDFPFTIQNFKKQYTFDWEKNYRIFGMEELIPCGQESYITFMNKNNSKIELFSGMAEILQRLSKKYKLGMVTSNHEELIRERLQKSKIEKLFDCIVDCNFNLEENGILKPFQKPNPEPLLYCLNQISQKNGLIISPNEAAMVGDHHCDIEAGLNARTGLVVGAGWGDRTPEELQAFASEKNASNVIILENHLQLADVFGV